MPEDRQQPDIEHTDQNQLSPETKNSTLIIPLILTALAMVCMMTIYEAFKQLIFPQITIWESHFVTIVFSSTISTIAAYFVLRNRQKLLRQALEEIAERKRMEEALRLSEESLERRVAERTAELEAAHKKVLEFDHLKDRFAANVSHEMGTPITNLKLYCHMLPLRPEKQDVYLAALKREITRLERIVADLLYLSRLDRDQIPLTLETVDLNTLVETFVADHMQLAEQKALKLAFDRQPQMSNVQADPISLERILGILLTNAFNYGVTGSLIKVATHMFQSDGKQWAVFSVSNTGSTIALDELQHLFKRFFRGKAALYSGKPGIGLGLATAKELTERHQGHIEATSGESGVTFTVWLPAEAANA
ncbi:MAG: HAMP domain-containing histidine kinase [Anaerolineae bacterium]|nr:HAMP domain-containing histidine kinase [Anaerolineae bacterium]